MKDFLEFRPRKGDLKRVASMATDELAHALGIHYESAKVIQDVLWDDYYERRND